MIFALFSTKKRSAPMGEKFLPGSPKKRSAHRSPQFLSILQYIQGRREGGQGVQ